MDKVGFKKQQIRVLYRAHSILHTLANAVLEPIFRISVPTTETVIILSVYAIVRFHAVMHPLILFAFVTTGILACSSVLKLAIQLAVDSTTCSQDIAALGMKSGRVLTKEDQRFFRSCRPLEWRIGDAFTLRTDTFRRIMHDIIIQAVINLLITY
jgi:hypothetical protein